MSASDINLLKEASDILQNIVVPEAENMPAAASIAAVLGVGWGSEPRQALAAGRAAVAAGVDGGLPEPGGEAGLLRAGSEFGASGARFEANRGEFIAGAGEARAVPGAADLLAFETA